MSAHPTLATPPRAVLTVNLGGAWLTRRRLSLAAGLGALIIGAVALAGRLIEPDPLGSAIVWNMSVKASTAVAFLALGAVPLLHRMPAWRPRELLAAVLLVAAGIVASLALVEYVAPVRIGVDTLLFHDDAASAAPARMSIGTSIGLVLLAASGATLLVARLRGRIAIALCTFVTAIATLSVLGHLFVAAELQGVGGPTTSALFTPLGLGLIAVSILADPRLSGPFEVLGRRSRGGHVARVLFMVSIIVVPVIGVIWMVGERHGMYSSGLGAAMTASVAAALLGGVGVWLGHRVDQAERGRRTAERHLLQLIAQTDEAVGVMGADGRLRELSPAWTRLLGYDIDEVASRPFIGFVHEDDIERTLTRWSEGLERGEVTGFVNRVRHRDGSYRSIESSWRIDPDTRDVYIVTRDITARAEQEREHALLAAIVTSTGDAVTSADLDGNLLTWNPAAEALYGYSVDEVVGRPFTFLIPPERPDEADRRVREIQSGASLDAWETVRMARDGRRIPVSVTLAPLRDAAGVLIGETVITRDNTAIRAAADRLQAAAAALSARNAELRDFASVVSHDLRAPLRRLQLFAEMATDAPGKDAEVSDLLERIRSSAGRMEALVVDLLSFARLGVTAGGMRSMDLAEVVREAIEVQQSALTVSRAMVEVGDLPLIEGDPVLLRQVFANLIGNAVKFARQGVRPAVSISACPSHPDELGREVIEIAVGDNGIGFDPEYGERIFRIFERVSTEHAGTGVGLAICRKIVALHRGTISATSRSGEGATFTIRLPIEQPAEAGLGA